MCSPQRTQEESWGRERMVATLELLRIGGMACGMDVSKVGTSWRMDIYVVHVVGLFNERSSESNSVYV